MFCTLLKIRVYRRGLKFDHQKTEYRYRLVKLDYSITNNNLLLQRITHTLEEVMKDYGMKINVGKTKVMRTDDSEDIKIMTRKE